MSGEAKANDCGKSRPGRPEAAGGVIYVTYKGDQREVDGIARETLSLEEAMADLGPGDVVQLLEGKYWTPTCHDVDNLAHAIPKPIRLVGVKGTPERPVVIRGRGRHTVLCGSNSAITGDARLPELRHFAFFKLIDCEWIVFENFYVESCWPSFLYMENSRYVTVRDLIAYDARYLVFCRGKDCHHILLEGNFWRQDPTDAMWRDILWSSVKTGDYYFLNGGLFGSAGVSGSVIIRRNTVCNAFNAVRMKGDEKHPRDVNLNVEIYENVFFRIRDNPIEPERSAVNWMVWGNAICNAHKYFSLDEVAGGFWYFFGNLGWFTDKPGQSLDPNVGGAVFKYEVEAEGVPFPDMPYFAFNNSWHLRSNLIKDGGTRHFTHRANAVLFCAPADLDAWSPDLPCPGRAHCGGCVLSPSPLEPEEFRCAGPDAPLPGFLADPAFLDNFQQKEILFAGDLSNKPFSKALTDAKLEQGGLTDFHYAFVAPFLGDLRLRGEITAGAKSRTVLRQGKDWPGDYDWASCEANEPPAIGAWQDADTPFAGPPFVFYEPENRVDSYVERPRVVALRRDPVKRRLTVHFSTPLRDQGPVFCEVFTPGQPGRLLPATIDGTRLTVALPKSWEGPDLAELHARLPEGLAGTNGEPATAFACADPAVVFPNA